jgi:hypothetical protein
MFAVMLPIAAIRVIPSFALWARLERPVGDEVLRLTQLIPMLVDRDRTTVLPGMAHSWPDYRAYVGPLLAGAAIAGAGTAAIIPPRRWPVVLLTFLGLALVIGPSSPIAPATVLARVPGVAWYAQFGARSGPVFALAIAAAAGVAYDEASRRLPGIGARVAIAITGALAIADPTFATSTYLVSQLSQPQLPRADSPRRPFAIVDSHGIAPAEAPARGVGIAACNQDWGWVPSQSLQLGERSQAWIDGRPDGVTVVDARADRIELALRAPGPALVHVNQTFDPDWSADAGETGQGLRGSLDVAVPAGASKIVLRYRPAGLLAAYAVLGGSALVGLAVAALRFRRFKTL